MTENPVFTEVESPNSPEVSQRLEAMFGRHAVLTERLREMTDIRNAKNNDWQNLESQVASLRLEMEGFKRMFTPEIKSCNSLFSGGSIEFLSLKI